MRTLPLKERRTTKIAKLLNKVSIDFFESPIVFKAIDNSKKYSYTSKSTDTYDTDRFPGTTITITEMYPGYPQALDEIRK